MSRITFVSDITTSGTSEFKVNDTEDITTRDSGSMLTYGGLNVYKKTLLQDDLVLGGNIETQKRYPNWPNWVIGYYDFAAPTNLGNDVSSYGYHSVNYSGYYSSTTGSRSNIANFSQTQGTSGALTQRIELPNTVYKDLRNFSVSLWIYVDTPVSAEMCIIAFADSTTASTTKIKLFIDTSNFINFALFNGGSTIFMVKSTSVIPDLTWTHVVISAGTTGNWMYVNGVLQTNYTTSSGSNTNSISTLNSAINYSLIGANANTSSFTDGFGGSMADVMFTNTQLTAGEIGLLYADNYGYEVYSLMGQSNMVGYPSIDTGIDDDYTIISGKVYQYPYDVNNPSSDGVTFGTTITAATNPLDFISGVAGGSAGEVAGNMGMWKTFVENLVPSLSPHRKILLIPAAKGGTSFNAGDWLLTGAIYIAAKGATNAAINLNSMNTLRGILWIQGESDADVENHNYLNGLNAMYSDLSSTFGQFPFIISTILGSSAGSTAIADLNNLLYTFSKKRGVFIVDTTDLSKSDIYHYISSSLRTIGERMYYALTQQASVNNFNKDTSFYNGLYLNKTNNAVSIKDGGSLTVRGGASFAKDSYIGGTIYADNTFGFDKIQQLTYINNKGYQVKTSSTATPITTDFKVINKRTRVTPQTVVDTVSTWTSRTSAANNDWSSVCWSPELKIFVAVSNTGTGNRVMTSPDSITWTSRTSAADNNWSSVCWSPELGLFAAVGVSGTGNRVMTSPDAITWTSRTSAADDNFQSICWSPELLLFVAVASSGVSTKIMTSPNGTTWTSRTGPTTNNQWISVCWSPELSIFVAVASTLVTNSIMTSPDGIVWTNRNVAAVLQWFAVAWSPELYSFAAVASTGTGNRVMTSSDGIVWTSRTTPADNNWNKITWSKELSLFVAVATTGTGNRIMTSSDLVTWTVRTNPVDNDWSGICWSPQLSIFAAVSKTGTGNRVMTSAIGIPDRLSTILVNPSHLSNNDGILSFSKTITSTLSTGTAPFTVASTTNVANLNASTLSGATFASPGSIGSTTAGSGAFTTVSASNIITSTLSTGTAPFTVASTTNVANLNASTLSGATFGSPGAIGDTTPGTGTFTTLATSGTVSGAPGSGLIFKINDSTWNDSITSNGATTGTVRVNVVGQPTLTSTNGSVTTTNATTLFINGPPLSSASNTITNAFAMVVLSGTSVFGGIVNSNVGTVSTSSTTGSIITNGGFSSSNTTDATSSTNGGTFTTAGGLSAAKQIISGTTVTASRLISNVTTGTAPFTVASTTNVANLNASTLSGATFASPGSIGSTSAGSGAFTTVSATGVITSTLVTGTAPFTVASTTNVANLNASTLSGATFASPGSIGSTSAGSGAFTTVSATGVITSTLATGTAPFTVASTTNVANLNASSLGGATFASPGSIGSTSAGSGAFTTLTNSGAGTNTNTTTIIGGTSNTISSTSGALNVAGDISFYNNSSLNFSSGGGPPTFTNRSVGTKIVLFANTTASAVDHAIGVDTATTWFTVPSTGSSFKFYGATTLGLTINGNGRITSTNTTASTTSTSGAVLLVGGIGINNTTDATSSTNGGTITTDGGIAAAKQIISGTNVTAVHFNTGYTTTATAAGTTTLTATSNQKQFFTGATTQTVVLPVVSTLVLGFEFQIVNTSSGIVTVQSSGANTVTAVAANTRANLTCILTTGTTAASWSSV